MTKDELFEMFDRYDAYETLETGETVQVIHWHDLKHIAEEIVKNCSIPDVVKSFGCGWNFCDAVLDKRGVVTCGKCNMYE